MKISLTPYYSSSWDVPILLYESLKTLKWLKNKSKKLNRSFWSSKNDFRQKSAGHHFFELRCETLVPSFNLDGSYKHEIPSGWHYLLIMPSPEMHSNQIWTDKTSFIFNFKSLASSICCKPHFSRFPWLRITLRVGMWTSCSTSH